MSASIPTTPEEDRAWDSMIKPPKNPDPYFRDGAITSSSGYFSPYQKKVTVKTDPINPDHYKQEIEMVDFMRANAKSHEHFIEFARLTALGYVGRAGKKQDNPVAQDAAKAIWWLTWLTGKDPRK